MFELEAGVEELAGLEVLAYEDAAAGVLGGVAGVDADAVETADVEQQGQPLAEAGTPRDGHGIPPLGDGEGFQRGCLRERPQHGGFVDGGFQFECGGFEGVAEVGFHALFVVSLVGVAEGFCVGDKVEATDGVASLLGDSL